jgi:Outer membrane protein beta-barrel domain
VYTIEIIIAEPASCLTFAAIKKLSMRKMLTAIAVMTIMATANAQTQKNDWMVGGNFRLNTAKNNTQIAFTPNAGLFVIDNLAVGGNITLSHSKSGDDKVTSFGVGPFVRYYFTTDNQPIRPIIHSSLNFLSTKVATTGASSTNSGLNFFVGGGAAMFISENVSIDALMGYERTKYKDFDGSGGFSFNVGFQVYLLGGKLKAKN